MLRLASILILALHSAAAQDAEFFETKVRPVLAGQCFACHSAKAKISQGNLRMDSRGALLAGGHSGPAVVPGDPKASRLLQAVRHEIKPTMPPWGRLPDDQIAALEEWVRRGAPWPQEAAPPVIGTSLQPDRSKHWAWQPIKEHRPPRVINTAWPRQPVDHFVLSTLESKSLAPNGLAAPAILLRRVFFDLTGLPPSPEAVKAYIANPSPQHYETVVDELLSSPAFGERWGRHWLDITYYGDTMDANAGIPAPHAWRYRDYVIQSLNADKPINRFITEQIAGDLMAYGNGFEQRQLVSATGYVALGPWALVQADKVQLRMDVIDQQIDGIGKGLLGLTLGCARCHDHKFDPVSQREYYGLAGIFYSTRTVYGKQREDGVFSDINKVRLFESPEEAETRVVRAGEFEKAIGDVVARIKGLELQKAAAEKDPAQKERLRDIEGRLQKLQRRQGMLEFNRPQPPLAYAVQDEETPGNCRITIRGNAHQLGEEVPRTFIKAAMFGQPEPRLTGSGRLQLARWIADDRNPLTPRVYVNRVWQQLFGAGIVKTADNFGLRGDPPSHPELLDYLAHTFVQDGWSARKLIRRLVLSQTYRMSSAQNPANAQVDPDNRLLWRMMPRRLEAESIRDAVLILSGQYDPARGGPTLPTDSLETFAPDLGKVNPPRMVSRGRLPDRLRNRRTVYLPVYRQAQMDDLDVLNLFDFANNSQTNATRRATVVPTQALFLMNSEWMREQSRVLARRLCEVETLTDRERARRVIEIVYNRPSRDSEIARALDFVYDLEQALSTEKHGSPTLEAWARFVHSLFASNEFLFRS